MASWDDIKTGVEAGQGILTVNMIYLHGSALSAFSAVNATPDTATQPAGKIIRIIDKIHAAR